MTRFPGRRSCIAIGLLVDGLDADLGDLAAAYERAAESKQT